MTKLSTKIYEDFTSGYVGKHHTINLSQRLNPDISGKTMMYIALNPKLYYRLFIHEKNFFLINFSPMDFPILYRKVQTSLTPSLYYRLALTEVEELDLPEDPCNTDPDYNFQACIKESLSSQVGCRTKWDCCIHKYMPICQT